MTVVPKLTMSCGCCTLKTGSFVVGIFILVGSSVQTGYYAFLVDHMYPQVMCTFQTVVYEEVPPRNDTNYDGYYPQRGSFFDFIFGNLYNYGEENEPPFGDDAAANGTNVTDFKSRRQWYNSYPWWNPIYRRRNSTYPRRNSTDLERNSTDLERNSTDLQRNSTDLQRNSTDLQWNSTDLQWNSTDLQWNSTDLQWNSTDLQWNSTDLQWNSTDLQWNSTDLQRNSTDLQRNSTDLEEQGSNPVRRRKRNPFWVLPIFGRRAVTVTYKGPCIRERRPFEVHSNYLDFDVRAPFNKTILYFNIVIWATMMAATPLLLMGVYKDSAYMVTAWLVAETLLLMVGTAGTVATAGLMFGVVPVSIGVVTLLNMAIHLGIDIYLLIVVFNYRRELTTKVKDDDDDTETERVIV